MRFYLLHLPQHAGVASSFYAFCQGGRKILAQNNYCEKRQEEKCATLLNLTKRENSFLSIKIVFTMRRVFTLINSSTLGRS